MVRGNNFVLSNFMRLLNDKSKTETHQSYEDAEGQFRYHIGIIDFLTSYTTAKKFETKLNALLHWSEADKTSCQHPVDYQKRFVSFLADQL